MIKEQEIPNISNKKKVMYQAKKKSKHKHHYEECLIQYYFNKYYFNKRNNNPHTSLSIYCTICGKLGDRFKEDKSIVKDYRRIIDTSTGRLHQVMTSEDYMKGIMINYQYSCRGLLERWICKFGKRE